MGHIVNSTAMRLGWTRGWNDNWYSNDQYYSELLYSCFRIRYYLIYFCFNIIEKNPQSLEFIYSHFSISWYYNFFFIEIFYHDKNLEENFIDFKTNFNKDFFDYNKSEKNSRRYPVNNLLLKTLEEDPKLSEWDWKFQGRIKYQWNLANKIKVKIKRKLQNRKKILHYRNKTLDILNENELVKPIYWHHYNRVKIKRLRAYLWSKKQTSKKVWFLIYFFSFFQLIEWSSFIKTNLWYFFRALNLFNLEKIDKMKNFILSCNRNKVVKRQDSSKLLFFCLFYLRYVNSLSDEEDHGYSYKMIKDLFYCMYIQNYLKVFFDKLCLYFQFIFSNLTNFKYFTIKHHIITNDDVNSIFLSRYIARKLTQKVSVKRVLNPLRKEFKRIVRVTSQEFLSYYRTTHKEKISLIKRNSFLKYSWCYLIFLLIIFYDKYLYSYYLISNTWFSLDVFLIYNHYRFDLLNVNDFDYELIDISLKFHSKRCMYVYFFVYDFILFRYLIDKILLEDTARNTFILNNSALPKIKIIFNFIFFELLTSNFVLFSFDKVGGIRSDYFKYMNYNYNTLISYNYFSYNYNSAWLDNSKINKLRSRLVDYHNNLRYRGFKIKCVGRFSRRQRASSYWFSLGRAPLNTIHAPIQYSFFSLPILNSAISVKVWLFVNKTFLIPEGYITF